MKYMGSKAKYARELLIAMSKECNLSDYENWVEPFVGGANMIAEVANAECPRHRGIMTNFSQPCICFKKDVVKWGNDINPYLIEMFKAVQNGWVPSDKYSEEDYKLAKENAKLTWKTTSPDLMIAEIGFIGIGCSYSGKWFGGYARGNASDGKPRNYAKESKDNLLKQKPFIQDVIFGCHHYKNMYLPKTKSIIYCDPPYAMTTKYKEKFESDKFWDWCNEMVEMGHKVFVSEYQAPEGWRCIWEKVVNSSLTKETGSKKAVERLFTK